MPVLESLLFKSPSLTKRGQGRFGIFPSLTKHALSPSATLRINFVEGRESGVIPSFLLLNKIRPFVLLFQVILGFWKTSFHRRGAEFAVLFNHNRYNS